MKPTRLDDQIRRHYGEQRLRPEARAHLERAMRTGGALRRAGWWWWLRTAAAAVFVIGATMGALWMVVFRGSAPAAPGELALAVARQAALEHNTPQELEFRVERTAELRGAMKSLDFTPVEPERISAMNMRVVGARYATIEGVLAAEIRYVEPDGHPCTLYLVRPVERLARIRESEHVVDGVQVTLWREKGLLMILARPLA
ncbi:MAG TPA: hypothetical protein VMS56_16370 [Thermoanaerobaculia bacterium]|nr:hypothetical protein [Thermoanaerobaculia bacterium]